MYCAQITPAYHGLIHVALIYLIGGSALWYAAQHIHAATPAEIAVIPIVVVLANIFEWFLHAKVMHRPVPGLMSIYNRHTLRTTSSSPMKRRTTTPPETIESSSSRPTP